MTPGRRATHTPARALPALLALLALLTLALAACGDDAEQAGGGTKLASLTPQSLALVADRTTATGGVRMALKQTMTLPGEATIAASGQGRFDTRTQRGEMTFSTDTSAFGGGGELPGDGKLEQRMIFDGLTFYVSSPLFEQILPAGKRWMKMDLGAIGKQAGIDLGGLAQTSGQDPTQALQYLKSASGDVTRVGEEQVRGVETTHYKATIDFEKVPDAAPADQRAAVRRSIEQVVKLSGTNTAPIEVWVDGKGIARRLVTTITTGSAAQRIKVHQSVELYDFGTDVDVDIPPASAVADAPDLGALGTPDTSTGAGSAVAG